MLNERSFLEILEALQEPEATCTSGFESHLDPFGMAQIIAEVKIAPLYKVSIHRKYPKQKPAKPQVKRKSHVLTSDQLLAFALLATHARGFQDNFNLHELKSAYRMSVLKTHPDQGGNSETFQEVKKSYQMLLVLVKN